MKRKFSVIFGLCLAYSSIAQNVTQLRIDTADLNMLIELAVEKSYTIKQNDLEIDRLVKEKDFTKNTWLEMFSVSGNLNELSLKQTLGTTTTQQNQQNLFFPRYNFGVRFTIGSITDIKHQKYLFSRDIDMLREEEKILETELRKEVKLAYYNYLILKEKYTIKKSFLELATATFNTTEKRFLEGDVQLEEFYAARETYSNFTLALLEAEEEFLTSKVNLESLVGTSIDQLGLNSSLVPDGRN